MRQTNLEDHRLLVSTGRAFGKAEEAIRLCSPRLPPLMADQMVQEVTDVSGEIDTDGCRLQPEEWRIESEKVRYQFLETLASRRRETVPLNPLPAEHAREPFVQTEISDLRRTRSMRGAAIQESAASNEEVQEENLVLAVEAGEQGKVPVLILKPKLNDFESQSGQLQKRPAVIFLHWTGADKEMMRPHMQTFAAQGYIAVAIDSRYHGERADSAHAYANGLISAWRTGQEMPFIFDTVWDLIKLMDYLTARPDICPTRIGILGISLGGMHAWYAAAADPRIGAVVCVIGVQNFGWAIEHESWHARVASLAEVFAAAKEDLGKPEVDGETVAAVWHRIAPGLVDKFDAEQTLPAIAPRPLLILNGSKDPRCPIAGLEKPVAKTARVYRQAGVPDNFKFVAEGGVGHSVCKSMVEAAHAWLHMHLD